MASKRRQRRRVCEGKRRHETEAAAWAEVNRNPRSNHEHSPYPCPHCGGWHVGHRPGFYRGAFGKLGAMGRMNRRPGRQVFR